MGEVKVDVELENFAFCKFSSDSDIVARMVWWGKPH
jgi:hypothetical protein